MSSTARFRAGRFHVGASRRPHCVGRRLVRRERGSLQIEPHDLLGADGPFADFYHGIAGATWANWLFMLGLAGIGIALIAGIAMRITAGAGALLLVLMWSVVLPPANNPFMDDHLVYALVLILLAGLGAGRFVGLGGAWERLAIVKRFGFLK